MAVAFAAPEPEPEPEPAKGKFRAAQVINDNGNVDMADDNVDNQQQTDAVDGGNKKGDGSSGRLFMKKFMLFKNMFGQKQPVIPIIITGGAGGGTGPVTTTTATGTSPPTTTITSTGTVPTATGTISVSPTGSGTGTGGTVQRIQLIGRGSYNNDDAAAEEEEETTVVDNQSLAAALGAGAAEYIVTDQEISGTSEGQNDNGSARVNLRRRGSKNGRVVSVRIPPKYRGYFKNGQRVILNTANRPNKRRIVKKRVIRKRNKKNKIVKRRRVVAKN
ncbi:uncharacterized protein [Musca autumnalis]|uniref:uncharacterized protein n=1 Tax=Musca autumnalis TaxID=221902 RepID=UPI003CE84291